jgi:hypothetical protein
VYNTCIMNEKIKVGLDVDGVLCCFASGAIKRAKELGLGDHFPADCQSTDYWGMSDEFSTAMKGAWTDEQFWLDLPPLRGSDKLNFTPYCYITSRQIPTSVTEAWLEKNGFPKALVITVTKPEEKLAYIREHNIDVFVDDLYTTVQQLRDAGVNAILYKAPYQRGHVEECKDLPTIESLEEIEKYV